MSPYLNYNLGISLSELRNCILTYSFSTGDLLVEPVDFQLCTFGMIGLTVASQTDSHNSLSRVRHVMKDVPSWVAQYHSSQVEDSLTTPYDLSFAQEEFSLDPQQREDFANRW